MTQLRPYQLAALDSIDAHHLTKNRVVCVMPTGAGKSVVGREWVRRRVEQGQRVLMLAHRIELLRQFQSHLASVGVEAGIIAPGESIKPYLPVQCASMDTMVARGELPPADALIADECHHAIAATWKPLIEAYPGAKVLGLTATPQRGDGKPLADLFDDLVIGAQYSELLKLGHITPCKVFRPERFLESDFAQDPVDAWIQHSEGKRGFVFCRSLAEAKRIADELTARGIPAANVDGKLAAAERERRMTAFARGGLTVLTNVHVLTEGVDVPDAQCCLLASSTSAACTYLQKVGRVLRSYPGKSYAILIDLPGVSHVHGFPTADRNYHLTGRAIETVGVSLRNCLQCGYTQPSTLRACESCGWEFPRRVYNGPKIWNLELIEYFENVGDLSSAPKSLKQLEWERLLGVCDSRGFGVGFAVKEYEKIFSAPPSDTMLKEISDDVKVRELKRLLKFQTDRGLKLGWISHAYKGAFGRFPSRELRAAAGVPLPSAEEWAR